MNDWDGKTILAFPVEHNSISDFPIPDVERGREWKEAWLGILHNAVDEDDGSEMKVIPIHWPHDWREDYHEEDGPIDPKEFEGDACLLYDGASWSMVTLGELAETTRDFYFFKVGESLNMLTLVQQYVLEKSL